MYQEHNFLDLDLTWLDEHRDLKLCYVEENDSRKDKDGYKEYFGYRLYFTPVDMKEQWGDDWDDAPYEYNAGAPYDGTSGKTQWIEHTIYILQIYIKDLCPQLPSDYGCNSPFSVDMINSRAVAWMFFPCGFKTCDGTAILAGMSPWEIFIAISSILSNPDNNTKNT